MSNREEPLPSLGFSDLDAMQAIVDQMQQMMASLQKEADKEAAVVEHMKQQRLAWKEQFTQNPVISPATTIVDYARSVPFLKASIDSLPGFGRILRANQDLNPGDLFLVEDVLVQSSDASMEPFRNILGFFTGAWGLIRAMSTLTPSQEALFADMANAHTCRLHEWSTVLQAMPIPESIQIRHKTRHDVANLIGIIHSNAFQYQDEGGETWRGVFPLAAISSHSCAPNTAYVVENSRLFFHAIRPIASGQELVQSYVQSFTPAQRRKRILWETFGFVCQCEVCATPSTNT